MKMKQYTATIGFFDGVHRGHRCLIEQLHEVADKCSLDSMIITFDRHPRQVVMTDYVPQLLSTLPEKELLLRRTGVQHIEVLPFTESLRLMTALEFMREILVRRLGVAVLLMGYDHRFGHGGGTMEQYVHWGQEVGIEVVSARPLEGETISSSLIRDVVRRGDMLEAARLLGYPYTLIGQVVPGHRVGRTLGFPTANIQVPREKLLPSRGVYAVTVTLPDGTLWKGVLNVGERPTLHNGNDVSVEVHLIDFIGDLYQTQLQIHVVCRLREERLFASTDELRRQIEDDCRRASTILDEV